MDKADNDPSCSQASKAWRKNKMDESKHEIHSQVDAITAGTASVVNLTSGRARRALGRQEPRWVVALKAQ